MGRKYFLHTKEWLVIMTEKSNNLKIGIDNLAPTCLRWLLNCIVFFDWCSIVEPTIIGKKTFQTTMRAIRLMNGSVTKFV